MATKPATALQEVEVALANRFLPLMMLPEAAQYSAEHQTRCGRPLRSP